MTELAELASDTVDALDTIEWPAPGTVRRGHLRFSHPALAGMAWPYTVARGAQDGPTLTLISGVHPTEYPAIESNIRTMRDLDPATLRGTVVSLPLVNVPSFLTRTPFVSPLDRKNPNRVFPGDPDGTVTEVIADAIYRAAFVGADALIDLHGGDMIEDLIPFTISFRSGNDAVDRTTLGMGHAFGLPWLLVEDLDPDAPRGTTVAAAAMTKIPAILVESGGRGLLTEPETQILVDGIQRTLRYLGMTDADAPAAPTVTELRGTNAYNVLRSPAEGMWYPAVAGGEMVTAGQVVGHIRDLFGAPVTDITTPVAGVVLYVTSSPAMPADGLALAIGGTD